VKQLSKVEQIHMLVYEDGEMTDELVWCEPS